MRWRPIAVSALRALIGLLVLWAVVRLLGLERGYPLVALIAFTPYAAALAVVFLAVALYFRRWAEAGAAAAAVVLLAVAVLPRAFPDQPTGPIAGGLPLDVLTVNVNLGDADAETIVELVRNRSVDLLSVQELTGDERTRLREAGIDEALPEQRLAPSRTGSSGAGIYSRYPLRALESVPGGISEMLRARVEAPGTAPVEVVTVHPFPPTGGSAPSWLRGLEALPPADAGGPIRILPGDFNSGFDHDAFRELVATGYVDAAAALGQGLAPTWPSDRGRPPPVTIDHVLADERVHVADVEVIEVPETDHRAVYARLLLPPERG